MLSQWDKQRTQTCVRERKTNRQSDSLSQNQTVRGLTTARLKHFSSTKIKERWGETEA